MKFELPLSVEQQAIFDTVLAGKPVSVKAGAGSGKSHTARGTAKNYDGHVESVPFMRSLCNEEELAYRDYSNIRPLNFHRHGLRLATLGKKPEILDYKLTTIAQSIDADNARAIAALASMFKAEAIGIYDKALTPLAVAKKYSMDTELVSQAMEVLKKSDDQMDVVDFADMLRFPVLLGRRQVLDGLTIFDEVQDYTPLSWVFVRDCLTTPTSHVLMIGDPDRQMLMAFAGASQEIFDIMSAHFGCTPLRLTVNRRCSKRVVDAAPFKGDMVALPDAPEGSVESKSTTEVLDAITDGKHESDAVLSEVNAPLVQLGLNLLTKGVPCRMRSTRIEKAIKGVSYKYLDTRKFAFPSFSIAEACKRDAQAQQAEEGTATDTNRDDIINCIASLESYCIVNHITKTEWVRYGRTCKPVHPIFVALNRLLQSNRGITLLTGHTAKGMEWPTVFHLAGTGKPPSQDWEVHQANCLSHVIATRPRLNLVNMV